jgi:hypothetical protein
MCIRATGVVRISWAPIATASGVVLKFHTDGGDIRSFADNDAEMIKSRRLPRRQRCPNCLPALHQIFIANGTSRD